MATAFDVSAADRQLLVSWIRAGTTPQRVVRRAHVVLLACEGLSARAIARRLQATPRTVLLWKRRFADGGPQGLWRDAPGRGRKPSIGVDAVSRVRALLDAPAPTADRWTVRALAHASGLSRASVHRIVRALRSDAGTRERGTRGRLAARALRSAGVPV